VDISRNTPYGRDNAGLAQSGPTGQDKEDRHMRRLALIGLPLLLAGCNYVGNPYDGFGGFLGDTATFNTNPNKPVGSADNMRRVGGDMVDSEPLLPESGNIWPGPLPPARSLSDLQRMPPEEPSAQPPIDQQPSYVPPRPPRGSSTPPNPNPRAASPMSANPPPPPSAAVPPQMPPLNPTGRTLQTPNGPVSTIMGGNGVETFIQPGGRSGVVINNGNGTSTLIGTDGSTITVPATR
jgi:hypothetical protein